MSRYEIKNLTPVGTGGFGKVRKGEDTILGRPVAIKTLDPALAAASDEDKERFRREARILAKLSHPNIPSIYDVVFDQGKFEIIFQFVEGTNLRTILSSEGTIKLAECRHWFDQLASALGHAHDMGIIHRDIKPENIIISPDRKHCYLVDFGIALSKTDLERLTDPNEWIGTPGYMSPEQQDGKDLDASDDLYVLGICLYEALSGHRIDQGDYVALNSINELIPPAIDDLIRKCIEKTKPRRCQKATEFRNRFASALSRHRTLSELLTAGQLHEIVDAIANMTPSQFMDLKAAQRLLILQKCQDLVGSTDRRLTIAREEFLCNMTQVGILLPQADYKKIAVPAFNIGFGSSSDQDSQRRGSRMIRAALASAASRVAVPNHHEIVDAAIGWIRSNDLQSEKSWVFDSLRRIVTSLMANPECDDSDAPELAAVLATINQLQQSVSQPAEYEFDENGSDWFDDDDEVGTGS